MPKADKCLHRAVAREYRDLEDDSFHDFLLVVLPNLRIEQCYGCRAHSPLCGGENTEPHDDHRGFISSLESVRSGFYEEDSPMTERRRSLLMYYSSQEVNSNGNGNGNGKSHKPRGLKKINIDPDLLTGNSRIDRQQIAAEDSGRREIHSHDYDSVQDEYDSGVRVA